MLSPFLCHTRIRAFSCVLSLLIPLLTAVQVSGQAGAIEEPVWKAFLSWAGTLSPTDDFSSKSVLARYRSQMTTDGVPGTECDRRIEAIARVLQHAHTGSLREQQEWDRLVTNKYYAQRPTSHVYPFPPNAFLASVVKDLRPGKALDCAMGSGRDSIYLASKGWNATGFDRAEQGILLALDNAKKAGVSITAVVAGAENFDWGQDQFDLVSNIHSLGLAEWLPHVHRSLRTGGVYVVELPILPSMKDRSRMPAAYLPNEPLRMFGEGWRILRYEDVGGSWDCAGCRVNPNARIFRLVAQKVDPADWR